MTIKHFFHSSIPIFQISKVQSSTLNLPSQHSCSPIYTVFPTLPLSILYTPILPFPSQNTRSLNPTLLYQHSRSTTPHPLPPSPHTPTLPSPHLLKVQVPFLLSCLYFHYTTQIIVMIFTRCLLSNYVYFFHGVPSTPSVRTFVNVLRITVLILEHIQF